MQTRSQKIISILLVAYLAFLPFSVETVQADDVGLDLKNLIEHQDVSLSKIDSAINSLRYQSLVKTILVGRQLGVLRFESAQIKDQIYLLDRLAQKDEEGKFKIEIENRRKFLEEQHSKVENFVIAQEDGFSLFGWFVRVL